MRTATLIAILLPVLTSIASSSATAEQSKSGGNLTIKVTGMKNETGNILVHLFRPGDKVTGRPFKRAVVRVQGKTSEIRFNNIPFQNYYAMAVHDKNANGTLDHNAVRLPSEPVGFSNNWKISLFSGMPNYKKTGFAFSKSKPSITISVQ